MQINIYLRGVNNPIIVNYNIYIMFRTNTSRVMHITWKNMFNFIKHSTCTNTKQQDHTCPVSAHKQVSVLAYQDTVNYHHKMTQEHTDGTAEQATLNCISKYCGSLSHKVIIFCSHVNDAKRSTISPAYITKPKYRLLIQHPSPQSLNFTIKLSR